MYVFVASLFALVPSFFLFFLQMKKSAASNTHTHAHPCDGGGEEEKW